MNPSLDLDALEALCEAATPGPWENTDPRQIRHAEPNVYTGDAEIADVYGLANSNFIAASRAALPDLITECRRLRTENERLTAWIGGDYYCPACQADLEPGDTSLSDLHYTGSGYASAEMRCPQCNQLLDITQWESQGKYTWSNRYDVRVV